MAPSAEKMQVLLNECGQCADQNGMQWGIQKCHALCAPTVPSTRLTLAGQELQYADTAAYLGVQINAQGVTDGSTLERLRKAEGCIRMMRASGISRSRLSSIRLRAIYGSLVRPLWTYALHITPFTTAVEEMAASLIDFATQWVFPTLPKQSRRRARRLLGMEDA